MMDAETRTLEAVGDRSKVRVETGYFRGVSYPRVIVDVGGGQIPAETTTGYLPEDGDPVQIMFVDGKPFMLGPAVPKPADGVIATIGDDFVTVQTDYGVVPATYPEGSTFTSGQEVKLFWSNGAHVLSVMSTTPAPPPPPPDPGGGGGRFTQIFTATEAGAWMLNGSRWSGDEPRASNGYLGAWFYGTKIPDTIPADASLVSIEIFIKYSSRFGNPPNFTLHDRGSKGSSVPNMWADFGWAVNDGWNRFPAAQASQFFNALKRGGPALGVGLRHGGVNRFASLFSDPGSGGLRITWST